MFTILQSEDFMGMHKTYDVYEATLSNISKKVVQLYGEPNVGELKRDLIYSINGYVRTIEDFNVMLKSTIGSVGVGATLCDWKELIKFNDKMYEEILKTTSIIISKLINSETVLDFSIVEITNNLIKEYTELSDNLRTKGTHVSGATHCRRLELIKRTDKNFLYLIKKLINPEE